MARAIAAVIACTSSRSSALTGARSRRTRIGPSALRSSSIIAEGYATLARLEGRPALSPRARPPRRHPGKRADGRCCALRSRAGSTCREAGAEPRRHDRVEHERGPGKHEEVSGFGNEDGALVARAAEVAFLFFLTLPCPHQSVVVAEHDQHRDFDLRR